MARVREPYASRVARLEAQGYSRAQARGHAAEAKEPSIEAVRAVAHGRTSRIVETPVRQPSGRIEDRLIVTVITPDGKLKVYEMDPAAKSKLKGQLTELFPDAEQPEES